jgi:hypothetical protein
MQIILSSYLNSFAQWVEKDDGILVKITCNVLRYEFTIKVNIKEHIVFLIISKYCQLKLNLHVFR